MDSSLHASSSPPQPAKDIITSGVLQWRSLSKRIVSKQRAVTKLETAVPKSVRSKIDLKLPSVLKEHAPSTAADLSSKFNTAVAENQDRLRVIIHASAVAELQVLQTTQAEVFGSTVARLKQYFAPLHETLRTRHPTSNYQVFDVYFEDDVDAGPPSLAAMDCRRSIAFLDNQLQQEEYKHIVAEDAATRKREEAASKRTASEAMELDTSNDVLVASLVKTSIAKETAALRNEVNQLRAALNSRASQRGAPTGAKKLPQRKAQPGKGGARVPAPQKGKSTPNSKPRSGKPKANGPNAGPSSKPAGRRGQGPAHQQSRQN